MIYKYGKKSKAELEGVHPDMVAFCNLTLEILGEMDDGGVDIAVHDGIRTKAEQKDYVAKGVSWTMKSKHLKQSDGFGHAVDLVPYVNGKLRWEWEPLYKIFIAARQAADRLNVRIRWGGCWQTINGTSIHPRELVKQYAAKKEAQGKEPHFDGPHYELIAPK